MEVFEEFVYGSVWFSSNEGIRVKEDLTCSLRCYVKGRDSLLVTNELINHLITRHPSTKCDNSLKHYPVPILFFS